MKFSQQLAKFTWLLILVLLFNICVIAQVTTRRIEPGTLKKHVKHHKTFEGRKSTMRPIDLQKLYREDEEDVGLPPRFGTTMQVNLGFEDGEWEDNDQGRNWKLEIYSKDAYSINIMLDEFHLEKGTELYMYNSDKTMVMGPITSDQVTKGKGFATDLIQGNSFILELFEPKENLGSSKVHINKVIHGYRDMFGIGGYIGPGFGKSAPCHTDIECSQGDGWELESNSVAMILVNGERICSGSLINNACQDFTPNFLTAFHCLDADADGVIEVNEITQVENNWIFRFQYKSPSCNGSDDYNYEWYQGCTYRAALFETDFALVELDDIPDGDTGIAYAGWDRDPNAATSSVGIHHPWGDVMKISTENSTASSVSYNGGSSDHWKVIFDNGTVQHGSSGSPLFNQHGRVVGQLHGNQNNICSPADNSQCFCDQTRIGEYGKFSDSWGMDNNGDFIDATRNAGNSLGIWLTNNFAVTSVDLLQIPNIQRTSGEGPVCSTYTGFSLLNPPPTHTVSWDVTSNLSIISQGSASLLTKYSGTGNGEATISVDVQNNNSALCPVTATFTRDVQAGPFTTSQVSVSGTTAVCPDTYYTYTANVPGGHLSSYSYSWTYPSNWIWPYYSTNTLRLKTPLYNPQYGTVRVSVNNGCGTTSYTGVTVYPSYSCGYYYSYYPNPSTTELTIEAIDPITQTPVENSVIDYTVELYDSNQQLVLEQKNKNNKIKLKVDHLKKGTYFLHIKDHKERHINQIVIE